jgi:hypothetical protein
MPPKNCSHINLNYAFDFFGYMWTSQLGFFCSFQVYCLTLNLNYLKINSHKNLQI